MTESEMPNTNSQLLTAMAVMGFISSFARSVDTIRDEGARANTF